ncbi:MAG: type II toxin-antitoxin system VapC family toxin [Microcella pacifica]
MRSSAIVESASSFSAASAFEIATKYRLGRLDSAEPLVRDFTGIVERLGADQLPIRSAHGIAAGLLSWAHRDPFDRMLAAQASAEGLPLATVDRVFDEAAGVTVVWD